VEIIETFLVGLSEEFADKADEVNKAFLIDLASRYFRKVKLERTVQEMESDLDKDDVESAEARMSGYSGVAFSASDWIDPTKSKVVLDALQNSDSQPIVHWRGDLGTFLSPYFERDAFISFVGPEKRGKSYWLLETVWQAMLQRRRVLYYVVGDMSEKQVIRRMVTRAIRRPLRAGSVNRPIKITRKEKGVVLDIDPRSYAEPVSFPEAVRTMQALLQKTGSHESRLKIKCVGPSSLTASDIERDVRIFCNGGWIPDVVVVDYADNLAPEPSTKNMDYRHQVNESWKVMRRISSDWHLLFVTATQAAASAYANSVIRKSDFSEDKRKNAHVTGMLGINQTSEEKTQGIYRLNWVFLREGGWADHEVVYTAGCLGLACPAIISTL